MCSSSAVPNWDAACWTFLFGNASIARSCTNGLYFATFRGSEENKFLPCFGSIFVAACAILTFGCVETSVVCVCVCLYVFAATERKIGV